MNRVLVVEDETVIRQQLTKLLARNMYEVVEAGSVEDLAQEPLDGFDLIITDVRLPGAPGTDILDRAAAVPVLIMTSYASIRSAVECMQHGAADYIAKPFDHDELLLTVRRILKQSLLKRQNEALKQDVQRDYPIEGMIGSCAAMHEVFERVRRVAAADVPVLIRGESGTGKELVARAVHERSPRREGPFVAVNCAAIAENLIEAELFGHEQDAYPGAGARKPGLFEAADGGSLLLDEVAELSAATQVRLLRVLEDHEVRPIGATQSRKVNVRALAATHRDLEAMVRTRAFREDLYYRLKVMEIVLPPLRERGEDVVALAEHLLHKAAAKLNRSGMALATDAVAAIRRYRWPGNVRELGNAIERAVILCDGTALHAEHLALPGKAELTPAATRDALSLDEYFREFVLQHQDHMTESELARQLGISRKTLWERRSRMGIPRTRG